MNDQWNQQQQEKQMMLIASLNRLTEKTDNLATGIHAITYELSSIRNRIEQVIAGRSSMDILKGVAELASNLFQKKR